MKHGSLLNQLLPLWHFEMLECLQNILKKVPQVVNGSERHERQVQFRSSLKIELRYVIMCVDLSHNTCYARQYILINSIQVHPQIMCYNVPFWHPKRGAI